MKRAIISLLLAAVFSAAVLCGCDKGGSDVQETTADANATTAEPTTKNPEEDKETNLAALHTYDAENGDEFAGVWKITGGNGSQLESFVFMLDGHNKSSMILGNMGFMSNYKLSTDEDGKPTFETHFFYGLEGTYNYEFSKDKSTLTLTNTETDKESVLEKVEDYDFIPDYPDDPELDPQLFGAWQSENGDYYYFDKNGIMYNNSFDSQFTFMTYSAADGEITAEYTAQDKETDSYKYSIRGDKLTLNGMEYTRMAASLLNQGF